ncbi:hypothetical protein NDU88_004002 [Pleurodeles waltl]|uniref:Uncharacterized protein n=1 Tax=Pleurodeles waltl TaxID=8319 RepID=A0AAV7W674_PLEWA|nr:hypothetical protein NDU88_004002 [Pleurodeles waltl]
MRFITTYSTPAWEVKHALMKNWDILRSNKVVSEFIAQQPQLSVPRRVIFVSSGVGSTLFAYVAALSTVNHMVGSLRCTLEKVLAGPTTNRGY